VMVVLRHRPRQSPGRIGTPGYRSSTCRFGVSGVAPQRSGPAIRAGPFRDLM